MRWSRGSVTAGTKFTAHVQTPAPSESKISLVKVRGQARIMMMPLARIHDGLTAMFTNATNLKVVKLVGCTVHLQISAMNVAIERMPFARVFSSRSRDRGDSDAPSRLGLSSSRVKNKNFCHSKLWRGRAWSSSPSCSGSLVRSGVLLGLWKCPAAWGQPQARCAHRPGSGG